ncbi:MAG: c-type cytochrome [Myxococcales bacterium]|nr:c-type cytochrome [Myxococcales bacterium]
MNVTHPALFTRLQRSPLWAAALLLLSPAGCTIEEPSVVEPMPMPTPGAPACEPLKFKGLPTDALPPGLGKMPMPAPIVLGAETLPTPARQTGHAIAFHQGEVFAVDRDNDKLVVLDGETLKTKRTIALAGRPELVTVTADGTAFVSLRHAGVVAKIAKGAKTAQTWPVGVAPVGLALSADESRLWVALSGEDRVLALRTDTGTQLLSVKTAPRPRRVLVVTGTDSISPHLAVSHEWGRVSEIKLSDLNKGTPKTGPSQLRMLRSHNPTEPGAFMSKGTVNQGASTEPQTDRASRSVALAGTPGGGYLVGHTLQNRGVAQTNVQKASSGGYGGSSACSQIPQRPMQVSVTPRVASLGQVKHFGGSSPVRDPETHRDFLSRFDQPVDLVHHPSVSVAFLVATGTDNVLALNTAVKDPITAPLAAINVGQGPRGLALSADGKTAYVLNGHDFTVSRVDVAPLIARAVTTPSQAFSSSKRLKAPMLTFVSTQAAYGIDPLPPLLRKGRRIFHHTPNQGISEASRFACASCHFEGDEDKKVWFVDGEPRQTPALAGRLLGTAPFNWKGTEHALKNNMGKTIERMGGKGLKADDLAALEAFLTQGLVPPPNPNRQSQQLSAAATRGKKLFFDPKVACATCHTNGTGTNAKSFDVGIADTAERLLVAQRIANESKVAVKWTDVPLPYDTPSLRGVWHTAPYFHNGRARTLKEALKMTAKTMGHTDHLSEAQLDDLVAYLKTL